MPDAFDAWQAAHGFAPTVQIDGDEVVVGPAPCQHSFFEEDGALGPVHVCDDCGQQATPRRSDAELATVTAWARDEAAACERGTDGCSVDHTQTRRRFMHDGSCETW